MSRKPENVFIASVHRHLPPVDQFYRMKNNNAYNSGIADVWYSGAKDFWVEYKFVTLPARDRTVIIPGLSALQLDWCSSRKQEGRRVFVIVGSKQGGVPLYDPTEWEAGLSKADFVGRMASRAEIAELLVKEGS